MSTMIDFRFRSGERCVGSGWFEFDGYLDGSSELLPGLDELEISVASGQPFPRAGGQNRPCFWRLLDGVVNNQDASVLAPLAGV